MRFFHRTLRAAADSILSEGFRDATGHHMFAKEMTGVWLSDIPLDANEGAFGDVLLEIKLDIEEGEAAKYELIGEPKGYREWLMPAELINQGTRREVSQEEEDAEYEKRMKERAARRRT